MTRSSVLPGRPAPKPPSEMQTGFSLKPPFANWTFDVAVKTKDPFLIRGNLANGGALVDMKITGTGLKPPRRLVLERNASGSVAALAELPDVDAVFAANDAHAIGFLSGLRNAGLLRNGPASEQPVAVIGLGDLEMGRLIAPSLSTIRVHGDAIGRTAARLILSREGPRRIDLGFELVLRDSG